MSENVRMTSTARKFGRAWLRRLFWIFLRLNLVLLILSFVAFCYVQERDAVGSDWEWDIHREILLPEFENLGIHPATVTNAIHALGDAEYVFSEPNGTSHAIPLRGCFAILLISLGALSMVELLFLIEQAASGRRVARKLLRPLDRMAQAARELGRSAARAQSAGGEKLHDLESAISRIHPEIPEEKLDMGDRDLEGLQDAINGLLERMREANAQQVQFVSDASHELRTPIAVIQGYANMLNRWGKQDEKVLDESIAAIQSESEYMGRLVEQLLFLARGDSGRNQMEYCELDLGELMKEVCEEGQLIDPAHDWRVEIQPGAVCMGDGGMLKQCLRILTDNAAKYTPAGGVIWLRAAPNGPDEVRMQVQDTGMGIPEQDVPRVFDRFYRADPARSRAGGGAGLGLSIARWIVERHGGHFELLSRSELGTRVNIVLPSTDAARRETHDSPAQ